MASSPKTLPDVQHIGFPMSIQNERERVFFYFCNSPYNTSLLAADVFHIVASLLPEKRAANMTGKNDIRDVKPFVLIFANQNKGQNAFEWLIATSAEKTRSSRRLLQNWYAFDKNIKRVYEKQNI